MANEKPEKRHATQLDRIKNEELADPDDEERLLRMDAMYDSDNFTAEPPDDQVTKGLNTLAMYLRSLLVLAKQYPLTETTADEFNQHFMDLSRGTADRVKDEGLANSSLNIYQQSLRAFLYTCNATADAKDIALADATDTSIDPEDMLTRREIHHVRDVATHPRNRALFDFFLYTGQRNTATRTLRVGDVNLEDRKFRLNADLAGLKGADKQAKWRPLLLAESSIRQWLQTGHPAPNNNDAFVFVAKPRFNDVDPYKSLSSPRVCAIMRDLKERANIDKPMNPHMLRHNFVTIAYRRGMSEGTIKAQLGHTPDSSIMETTYRHLSDEDHMNEARSAFDLETESDDSLLTPDICPRCGSNPDPKARLCGVCGLTFTPDAEQTRDDVEESIFEDAKSFTEEEAHDALDDFKRLLRENPGIIDDLTDD